MLQHHKLCCIKKRVSETEFSSLNFQRGRVYRKVTWITFTQYTPQSFKLGKIHKNLKSSSSSKADLLVWYWWNLVSVGRNPGADSWWLRMAPTAAPVCNANLLITPTNPTNQWPPRVTLREGKEEGGKRRKQGVITCQQYQQHSHTGSQGRAWLWVLVLCSAAFLPHQLAAMPKAALTALPQMLVSSVFCLL